MVELINSVFQEDAFVLERKLVMEPSSIHGDSAVLNPTVLGLENHTNMYFRRVIHTKTKSNLSDIGSAKVIDGVVVERDPNPVISRDNRFDCHGAEDPRATMMDDGLIRLLYTAFDGKTARIALAESDDMNTFQKKGVISPDILISEGVRIVGDEFFRKKWSEDLHNNGDFVIHDKDAILFPRKINGRFAMLHRYDPSVQIMYFDSFDDLRSKDFWVDYLANLRFYHVMGPRQNGWENIKVGGGSVPIETPYGWLMIYHGVGSSPSGNIYSAGAALLDLESPEIVLSRLDNPLFRPKLDWECSGDVSNVVFPEGAVLRGNVLDVYYGGADKRIGLAKINFEALMDALVSKIDSQQLYHS